MNLAIIGNVAIKIFYMLCIVYLTVGFNNLNILWWMLLLPFLGFSYSSERKDDNKNEMDD